MRGDVTRSFAGVILLAGLTSASCGEVVPPEPTAPTKTVPVALAAEPARVMPEFLPPFGIGCAGARPFRTRFVLILGGMEGFVLHDLQVGFSDRFGVISVPAVLGASGSRLGSMTGSLPPIALPTSTPIPFPTTGPNSSFFGSGGTSERLPVILEFGCHVQPLGTIVVTAGTRDHRGRRGDHRLTIDVGE
jgi:hypothetical protein